MHNPSIFNIQKTDYATPSLLLGQQQGLFDTVNKKFPEIWDLYKEMKSLDWDENEFDYTSCNVEFKTCSSSMYDMMVKTLAWQWEADSVAARTVFPVAAPFVTSTELQAALAEICKNEVVHASTYSEIVRSSFDNPEDVLAEILSVKESLSRLDTVSSVMSEVYSVSHKYAIGQVGNNQDTYNAAFMLFVALMALERIQFMASFAVTFAICDSGMFMPIGKAIQKIAQDELQVHVALDRAVLKRELATDRGQTALVQMSSKIQALLSEVVESELAWVDYLFSEGRELVGINAELLKQWVLFNAKDVYDFLGVSSSYTLPEKNPLKFMVRWLDIGKLQPSPQEEQNGQYKVGVMRRNDDDVEFDVEF